PLPSGEGSTSPISTGRTSSGSPFRRRSRAARGSTSTCRARATFRETGPGTDAMKLGGKRGAPGQTGVSLVEVLFGLLMLSFGLPAIAPLFASSVKTGASSNQLASANTLAREKLEEVIGYPATDTRLAVVNGNNAAGPAGVTTTGSGSLVSHNT